jgi:hypothetical protein
MKIPLPSFSEFRFMKSDYVIENIELKAVGKRYRAAPWVEVILINLQFWIYKIYDSIYKAPPSL